MLIISRLINKSGLRVSHLKVFSSCDISSGMNRHECLLIVRNLLYEIENSVYVTYIPQLLNPLKKKHLSSYKPEDTTFCTLCSVRLYLSYIIGKTFTEYSEVKGHSTL